MKLGTDPTRCVHIVTFIDMVYIDNYELKSDLNNGRKEEKKQIDNRQASCNGPPLLNGAVV